MAWSAPGPGPGRSTGRSNGRGKARGPDCAPYFIKKNNLLYSRFFWKSPAHRRKGAVNGRPETETSGGGVFHAVGEAGGGIGGALGIREVINTRNVRFRGQSGPRSQPSRMSANSQKRTSHPVSESTLHGQQPSPPFPDAGPLAIIRPGLGCHPGNIG